MPDTPARTTHLSLQELRSLVLTGETRVAVFDFDGTLWPGDAGSGFMDWSIRTGLLSEELSRHLLQRHGSYRMGDVDEITICGEMTQISCGLPEEDVRTSVAAYFQQHVRPHLFPEVITLLRDLQRQGTIVWAVSSTNQWMIEEAVRELDIAPERVLAAAVDVEHGIVTDRLIHVPSDEGKAQALQCAGLHAPDAVFGNSIHDLAMLQMARLPVPVNPSEELALYSAEVGWPIYQPEASRVVV